MNVIVYVGTRASREVSYTSGYVCLMYLLGQDAKVFDRHDISVIVSGDIFCQIFLLGKDSCSFQKSWFMLILIKKKKSWFMLMSCLMSVLLELARLIGTYNMTYNISTVMHILACLFAHCLIFDHNFKFGPQAVLLCGVGDSFLGGFK